MSYMKDPIRIHPRLDQPIHNYVMGVDKYFNQDIREQRRQRQGKRNCKSSAVSRASSSCGYHNEGKYVFNSNFRNHLSVLESDINARYALGGTGSRMEQTTSRHGIYTRVIR